ncbi:AAA family ATPase [Streptomyces sp. NPDC005209]|uniref:AAA family ATPase n=1 Tax=Streptomyces sp. NPDC005209 TaxID=3156715 RepID=UPI0033B3D362
MQHKHQARMGAAAAGTLAVVTALLGPVTNYASEFVPGWARNPGLAWSAFALLSLLGIGLELMSRYLDREAPSPGPLLQVDAEATTRLSSLRPPHYPPELVRGRESELAELKILLRQPAGRFAVICGAGGIGKTTLATTLCTQAKTAGYTVFWVQWRNHSDLTKNLTQVAIACGLPLNMLERAHAGHENLPDAVWQQLIDTRKWLLVIDNADEAWKIGPEPEMVKDYRGWVRPEGSGLLLITSRDTSPDTWGPCAELVRLGPLTPPAAAQVLLDAAPGAGTRREAEALIARLGGLPLALRNVSAYLNKPTSRFRTFMAYRSALMEDMTSLLGAPDPNATNPEVARRTVRHTWDISLDHLGDEGFSLARPLMRLLSLFAEAPIPLSIITADLLEPVVHEQVNQGIIDATLAGLNRYGLLGVPQTSTISNSTRTITLDPLVRNINIIALAEESSDLAEWHSAAARRVMTAVVEVHTTGREGWETARILTPHATLLLSQENQLPFCDARRTVECLAGLLTDAGHYAEHLALRQVQLTADNRLLGPEHTDTLRSRDNLAEALCNLGDYRQAAELYRANLQTRLRTLGPEHSESLRSRSRVESALASLRQNHGPTA